MGELFGEKDYILDAEELRAWSRILEEPIHYGHAEGESSGRPPTKEPFGSQPRSVVIMPGESPQGYKAPRENIAAPQRSELPCAGEISTLVASVRDLVKVISNTSRMPCAPHLSGLKRAKRLDKSAGITPRLIRLRDAPGYLGMDPNRFNAEVRPYLTEMRIGKQGVGFDRLDLDAWAEEYKDRNGRPGKAMKGGSLWGRKSHQGSSKEAKSGTFRRQSQVKEFEKALQRATSRKRRDT